MILRVGLVTVAASAFVACGGGGGTGGGATLAPARTMRLEMAIDRSGMLADDQRYYTADDTGVHSGDDGGREVRGVVSILLRHVPSGAVVDSAVLRWFIRRTFGDAYGRFGDAILEHFDIGVDLEEGDFEGGVLTSPLLVVPVVREPGLYGELQSLDVTSAVRRDLLAGRLTSSFRIVFPLAPSADDLPHLYSINTPPEAPVNMPHVVLTYR